MFKNRDNKIFNKTDIIKPYEDKNCERVITEEEKKLIIEHCNKFQIFPEILIWHASIYEYYLKWVYEDKVYETEYQANEVCIEGLKTGEFCHFNRGDIIIFKV